MTVPANVGIASTDQGYAPLRELYPSLSVPELYGYSKSPLWTMCHKEADFTGEVYKLDYAHDGMSYGWTLSDAENIRQSPQFENAKLTRAKGYAVGRMENEAIAATKNDAGAAVRLYERTMKSAMKAMIRMMAGGMYRNGMSRGTIATGGISSNTITLTNKTDTHNFTVGQTIQLNTSADGSGTTHSGGSENHEITSINNQAGTLTVATLASDAAAGDHVICGSSDADLSIAVPISGLERIIPITAPTAGSDLYFGCDRGINVNKLSGWRLNEPSLQVKNVVQKLAAIMASGEAEADCVFMNPMTHYKLYEELNANMERLPGGMGVDGFEGFRAPSALGPLKFYADPYCPENRIFIGNTDKESLRFPHLGECPQYADEDGNTLRQVSPQVGDAVQFFLRFWGQLAIPVPLNWGVAAITPVNY